MQPSEPFVRPAKDEKDKFEKKEIDPKTPEKEHEGATEEEIGDRTGPGAGFDDEPAKVKDRGGVADS